MGGAPSHRSCGERGDLGLLLRKEPLRPQPKCPAESEESSWEPAARPVEKPDGLAPVVEVVSPGRELRPRVLL
ncbi:hypothetical protein G6O67_000878 [Ophiocordyceps sinensis]|uniref:Uncharacterized protein n=1 Tax=Ophiocordyceps sinensis TaxID=72228 RepID=A0A8H4Q0B1_9HYPO|nr:hypothetical protein G6O67_000878 [Ophiocordyceps sinensis]